MVVNEEDGVEQDGNKKRKLDGNTGINTNSALEFVRQLPMMIKQMPISKISVSSKTNSESFIKNNHDLNK